MNWINTIVSKIQTNITKKDYFIIGIVVFLSLNIGLGVGVFVHANFLTQPKNYKNANAQILNSQLENSLLKVELGVTIEENKVLDQIIKQNEVKSITKISSISSVNKKITPAEIPNKPEELKPIIIKDQPKPIDIIKPNFAFNEPIVQTTPITNQETNKEKPKQPLEFDNPINDFDGRKITYMLRQNGFNLGFVWATDIRDLFQKQPYNNFVSDAIINLLPQQPIPLQSIIPANYQCPNDNQGVTIQIQKNWLSFDKYNVQAPIINGEFGDFYYYDNDGQINLQNEIIESQNAINAGNYESVPVQRLLKAGIVHLPISPAPGQVGNSYIIGHTSNFPQVKSNYNRIFKSFESNSQIGDEFTIWDHQCRQMTFRVYEALAIDADDTDTAYKNVGNRRVVTLQGSILDANWQPTKRWLTRGELVQ